MNTRDAIFRLLETRRRPSEERDLYFLGGTACLILAHASQNAGDHRAALAQLRTSWTCAEIANHDALRAWSHGTAALFSEWSGRPPKALELAARGRSFNSSRESRIRLAAIEARAAARMGDEERAREALQHMHTAQEMSGGVDDLTSMQGLLRFPAAKQDYYIGSTYGLLGEHERAEQHAQAAISAYELGSPLERSYGDEALARIDVVTARVAAGDLDGASEALTPVLELPPSQRIEQLQLATARPSTLLTARHADRTAAGADLLEALAEFQRQEGRSIASIQ